MPDNNLRNFSIIVVNISFTSFSLPWYSRWLYVLPLLSWPRSLGYILFFFPHYLFSFLFSLGTSIEAPPSQSAFLSCGHSTREALPSLLRFCLELFLRAPSQRPPLHSHCPSWVPSALPTAPSACQSRCLNLLAWHPSIFAACGSEAVSPSLFKSHFLPFSVLSQRRLGC